MADKIETIELKGKPEILQIVETLQNQCKDAVSEVKNSSGKIDTLKKDLDVQKLNGQKNTESIGSLKNDVGNMKTSTSSMNNKLTDVSAQLANLVQTLAKGDDQKYDNKMIINDNGVNIDGSPDREINLPFADKKLIIKSNVSKISYKTDPSGKKVKFTKQFPNNCFCVMACGTYIVNTNKEKTITYWGLKDISVFDEYNAGFSYNGKTKDYDDWFAIKWIAIGY